LGFALSLTCVVIIARYTYSELTVDGFNKKLDRIFTTTYEESINPGNIMYRGIYNPNNEGNFPDISKHPGVEKHASFIYMNDGKITFDNQTYNASLLLTDTVFLQILDYHLITGINNVHRPEDAFITETFAAKIFGKENPVGKTLFSPTVNRNVTVAGIIRTPSNKSVLPFDVLASLQLRKRYMTHVPQSLFLLHPEVDYRSINRQYSEFSQISVWRTGIRYQLIPYKDIYFNKIGGRFLYGNFTYIFILSNIGILLLLIGLVNYINIHTVVMIRRNRELSMKKVFGAGDGRILFQLFLENLLLIAVSLLVAFWFAAMLHPFIENTFEIRQYPNLRFDISLAFVLIVALPLMTSVVPYLRYRYFSPVRSLRSANVTNKSLFFRKFFIGFQYFMTMGLITVSLFFVKQLDFMMNKNLGFRTQNIIRVHFLEQSYYSIYDNIHEEMNRRNEITAKFEQKLNESPLFEYWSYGDFPVKNHDEEFRTGDGELQKTTVIVSNNIWFNPHCAIFQG
jgi:hypothetical protein